MEEQKTQKPASELLGAWREKYPGAYDHVEDGKLLSAIKEKYPGAYDHYVADGTPGSSTPPTFGSEFYNNTVGAVKGMAQAAGTVIQHGIGGGSALLGQQVGLQSMEDATRAHAKWQEGKIGEAVGAGISAIPLVGAQVGRPIELAAQGNVGAAAGNVAGSLATLGVAKYLGGLGEAHILPPNLPPKMSLLAKGTAITDSLPGRAATKPVEFGEHMYGGLRGAHLDSLVDTKAKYDIVRENSSLQKQTVHVANDAKGKPILAELEAPVQLAPVQEKLQPVAAELARKFSGDRARYNPAVSQFLEFMNPDRLAIGAIEYDGALGAMKEVLRSSGVSDLAKRLLHQTISAGEEHLANTLGPSGMEDLTIARESSKRGHQIGRLVKELTDEPAMNAERLFTGGDKYFRHLQKIKAAAPEVIDMTGKTLMNSILDKAKQGDIKGAIDSYGKLGPDTRAMFFGGNAPAVHSFLNDLSKLEPLQATNAAQHLETLLSMAPSHGVTGMAAKFLVRPVLKKIVKSSAISVREQLGLPPKP